MNKPTVTLVLAMPVPWAMACNIVDDQPQIDPEDATDGSSDDDESCTEDFANLLEAGCPPGSLPQQFYDGGTSTVMLADDPAAQVGLGVGLVVHFGGQAGADWVGYQVTQNSKCTTGCFLPSCPTGQDGCFANWMTGALCAHYCTDAVIDQHVCDEFALSCTGADPTGAGTMGDDGGLDETGGDGDGGDDETTGGVIDSPYDCTQWHPELVGQPVAGGPFHLPQALVDELVQSNADALAECDGVRLRPASSGRWMISKMRSGSGGLLGALGLRVGDELAELDGVGLDSTDALLGMLGRFIDEDGGPRQFSPGHPGFALRVRRGEQELEVGLRVVPSTIEMPAAGS